MAKKSKNKARTSIDSSELAKPNIKSVVCCWDGDVLVLNILGTPNAKKDAIGKIKGNQLCVSVKEIPKGGKATDYMVKFLAPEFGVRPTAFEVVFGRMNINKRLRISQPAKLPTVLQKYLDKRKQP